MLANLKVSGFLSLMLKKEFSHPVAGRLKAQACAKLTSVEESVSERLWVDGVRMCREGGGG